MTRTFQFSKLTAGISSLVSIDLESSLFFMVSSGDEWMMPVEVSYSSGVWICCAHFDHCKILHAYPIYCVGVTWASHYVDTYVKPIFAYSS